MNHHAAILHFLEEFWGEIDALNEDEDLFARFGIEGDDAFEFMERFAARFDVDVSGYRWYFHHGEEGWSIGGLFFRPPDRRVARIPVTRGILAEALRTKRWPLEYPEHTLPHVRWDMRLNLAFAIIWLLPGIASVVVWFWPSLIR